MPVISFPVDAVTPATEPLPTRPLGSFHEDALWTAGDPDLPVLAPDGVHPLLGAVARAFADHRPLVLSPDAVWVTVLQGVARHIRVHAEELRDRLVAHQGRELLTVVTSGAPVWPEVVAAFERMLPAGLGDVFACDFSTSTAVERMAGRVVLMDAYAPYFAFRVVTLCGIPSITLTGTIEDWQRIRERVGILAAMDLGLENWCRSLAPITDHLVRAAAGEADTAFWQRIYKPADAYGGEKVTGWAARLYPYVGNELGFPNPLLDLPIGEPRDTAGPDILTDDVRAELSRVKVLVEDRLSGGQFVVELHAGVVAIAQDADGALRPIVGCHLTRGGPELEDVLERVEREGRMGGPAEFLPYVDSAELNALYGRFGSGSLFGGAWRMLPFDDVDGIPGDWPGDWWVAPVFGLADGRSVSVAGAFEAARYYWIIARWQDREMVDDPADIRVYATSLAALLQGALDTGGDIGHLDSGPLSQYLAI
jgi:hypothetical protein